ALRVLDDAGAPGRAMLSGSGGACFALFAAEPDARAFAARLRAPAGAAVHVVPFASSEVWREAPAGEPFAFSQNEGVTGAGRAGVRA
ncbi:MAG TPA: hypothetical protein VK665_17550, partial [Candidatus Elarobacter sp.]|nr:hypothetical protein [Candidatus Elarobacter sp.]